MPENKTSPPVPTPPLSSRESEILELAANGLIDKQIAAKLGVQLATVRTYWERIYTKLKSANRAQAIALGMPHNRLERVAEEMAAFALRNIEDEAISACDKQQIFLTWNKGVQNLFGYSEEEWVGQHNSLMFVPEEKEEAPQEFKDADKAGASVNDRWHMRKDGSRFWGTNIVIPLEERHSPASYIKIIRIKQEPDSKS